MGYGYEWVSEVAQTPEIGGQPHHRGGPTSLPSIVADALHVLLTAFLGGKAGTFHSFFSRWTFSSIMI